MKVKEINRWAVLWRKNNKLDGKLEHLIWDWKDPDRKTPVLFLTRREARIFAKERYGYISERPDLRNEPHGWKPVKVVKVKCKFEYNLS